MATEASNIMDAFYAGEKKAEIKKENEYFKRGPLGYLGGVTGFAEDATTGLMAKEAFDEGLGILKNVTDPRTESEKLEDAKHDFMEKYGIEEFLSRIETTLENAYLKYTTSNAIDIEGNTVQVDGDGSIVE